MPRDFTRTRARRQRRIAAAACAAHYDRRCRAIMPYLPYFLPIRMRRLPRDAAATPADAITLFAMPMPPCFYAAAMPLRCRAAYAPL